MYKQLLSTIDGSSEGNRDLAGGLALAKKLSAKVTVVTATEPWTEAVPSNLTSSTVVLDHGKTVCMVRSRMWLRNALAIFGFCIVAQSSPALAQMGLADPKRGLELSTRVCSGCHIVSSASATTANADVPTFSAIARRPETTAERLAGRIIVPHPPMPNVQLTIGEMRDIIAYILSLRPER
jgi:cytochrome c